MFGLYLLDVCVSELTLNKEVYIDTAGSPLLVKVVVVNFPPTEVKERDRFRKDDELYVYKFKRGQSIHFSMESEELVKKLKKIPLSIGIFRVDDSFPICCLQTHLSGCACDLNSLLIESPTPFKFRGPFELTDPGKSFAGQLDLDVTIFNLGRCLLTLYALAPNCFLFKTDPEGTEYKCNFKKPSKSYGIVEDDLTRLRNPQIIGEEDIAPSDNLIKDIAGIASTAEHLAEGSPAPKPPRVPLVDPSELKRRKRSRAKGRRRR